MDELRARPLLDCRYQLGEAGVGGLRTDPAAWCMHHLEEVLLLSAGVQVDTGEHGQSPRPDRNRLCPFIRHPDWQKTIGKPIGGSIRGLLRGP